MSKIVETIADEEALQRRLIELSQDGQAWVYSVTPFSHEVTFRCFASPSRVPDHYYDLMAPNRLMGYRGKLVTFTKAAIIREQNRGLGSE
jgi:hypothetical protein